MRLLSAAAFFAVIVGPSLAFEPVELRGSKGFEAVQRARAALPRRERSESVTIIAPRDAAPRDQSIAAGAARVLPAGPTAAQSTPQPTAQPVLPKPVVVRAERQNSTVIAEKAVPPREAGIAQAGAEARSRAISPAVPSVSVSDSNPTPVKLAIALPPEPKPISFTPARRYAVAPPVALALPLPPAPKPPDIAAAPPVRTAALPLPMVIAVTLPPAPMPPRIEPAQPMVTTSPRVPAQVTPVQVTPVQVTPPPVTPPQVAMVPDATPPSLSPAPAPAPVQKKRSEARAADPAFARDLRRAINSMGSASFPPGVLADMRRFYANHGMRAVFTDGDVLSATGQAVLGAIEQAETEGLDPRRFQPLYDAARAGSPAMRELALAGLAVSYARDARGARIPNPAVVISQLVLYKPNVPDGVSVLTQIAGAADGAAALASYLPQHPGYAALRTQLARARTAGPAPEVKAPQLPMILPGPELATGMTDTRVPALRARLGLPAADDLIFDEDINEELVNLQRYNGLRPSGILDAPTVAMLNAALTKPTVKVDTVADIIVNMERWRWMPADFGATHVLVNVPGYTLQMQRAGKAEFSARVIVGEDKTPTPQMSNRIDHMVINPSWSVPPNIARREYMPMLKEDPKQLAEEGIQVYRAQGGVRFFQPPGDKNGLGRIKIVFPNSFTVHLHDTPEQELFDLDRRAESNGCVRVKDPFALASAVLDGSQTKAQLMALIGPREKRIDVPVKVPVHLVYFTHEVDGNGKLVVHEDIYGHDAKMRTLLGL